MHGLGHGEVRLAGPGRPDAEGDDVLGDGVDVALLPGRVGAHRLAAGGPHDLGAQHLAGTDVLAHHVDGAGQSRRIEILARLDDEDQFLEELDHQFGRRPLDGDAIALHRDLLVGEGLLDLAQVLVAGAEQAGHEVVARHVGLGPQRGGQAVGHCLFTCPASVPPSTCRWRCGIEFMASGPTLKISR